MMLAAHCTERAQLGTEVLPTHGAHGAWVEVVEVVIDLGCREQLGLLALAR